MCVFHPGRQGARDTIIPLVCCVEPQATVPTVLSIIKLLFLVAGLVLLLYICAIPEITVCLGLDFAIIKMIN